MKVGDDKDGQNSYDGQKVLNYVALIIIMRFNYIH